MRVRVQLGLLFGDQLVKRRFVGFPAGITSYIAGKPLLCTLHVKLMSAGERDANLV